jgi:1-deoxy-D-xylulose-5-phosphate reductoisomerase
MRLPIGYALAFPERLAISFGAIDWSALSLLQFEQPERALFRCLDLAYRAGRAGDLAPAWLNAANEVAVAAFLAGRIPWSAIADVVEGTLDRYDPPAGAVPSGPGVERERQVGEVLEADAAARRSAEAVVTGREAAA